MSVEIFNRTKYDEEVLKEAAEFAHGICGIEGEVAVVFRYHAHSTGYIGLMTPSNPYFGDVAGNLKKFQNKKYIMKRGDFNPSPHQGINDLEVAMATKDGALGYITVRMPRAKSHLNEIDAKSVMNTILHEMYHIKQYRNPDWALEESGCRHWNEFIGYSGRSAAKRVAHQSRPIEQHVNRLLDDLQPSLKNNVDYMFAIVGLTNEMSSTKMVDKAKKKQTVKYNKYGERMSDYRNVKMKRLRNGDQIVTCPHCGEQAVNLHGDLDTFTHIAAVDSEAVRFSGFTPSECRTTQFGHMVNDEGDLVDVIEWGYRANKEEPSEDVFKSFNNNFYRG